MPTSTVVMTVRISELEQFRQFVWELRMLADRMRVEASPHAEALERSLERFMDSTNKDDEEPE